MSFLDKTGLEHFWAQCLNRFAHKETVANLSTLVGTTAVATQISDAIDNITFPVVSVNNKAGAVSLNASDVGALPASTVIPDALADLTSDATHRTVTDTEKATWNAKSDFSGNYNDLTNKPTIPSISGLATETYVDNKVASMVDSAPETLNTLNELAAALGDDPNFATTVVTEIGGKVSKSGDTMTGQLTATQLNASIGNSYTIMTASRDNKTTFLLQQDPSTSRVQLMQIHPNSTFAECYRLPYANAEATADINYDILTTKSPVTIAQGGTGATTATNALTNLGALPGQSISYTLSTAGWYRIASSAVNINNNIGDFIISGGGSGTHSLISFKASIGSGKYPQIVQLLNTTYSGLNQYTKARIVYHTTYSGNYAYLEVYKNGTASSSTKFMYYGAGWTLQAPVAGSIPDGYTSKEFTFIPQTSIATDKSMNIISDASDEVGLKVKNSYGQISFIVHNNRGIYDYVKASWVLKSVSDSADWYFYGSADSAGILKSSATPTYGLNGLQYFNASLLTSDTADGTISYAPTADWWHILRMNHGNTDGYYVDIGACFHQDYLAYRRVTSGTDSGWVRILDEKSGLMKTGGTMTGALSLASGLYSEGVTLDATQYALDMNNSNIIGANGIYMNDASDGITEGIHFYRSTTTYDSIWAAKGKLYFTPNRPLKGAGTAYTVYHTGNKPTASDVGALPLNPASIEMYADVSANHGGFIDFHYNGSTSDHTSRIIEDSENYLNINAFDGGKVKLGLVTMGTWQGSAIGLNYGGTGATTRAGAINNLFKIGVSPITSTTNDTVTKWVELGNGVSFCGTSSQLVDQPAQYGTLLNLNAADAEVSQLWFSAPNGAVYHRGANASGWSGSWIKFYDTSNKPTASELSVLSLSGGTLTGLLTGTRAHFTSTTDASEASQNNVALRLGATTGIHMDLDNNEIIAKTDATTQGTLYLNGLAIAAGGGVSGNMTVSGTLTAAKVVGAVYA